MENAHKLRPTSDGEAREFVQLCLRQGMTRDKIAVFLVRLGLNPSFASLVAEDPELSRTESSYPSLELELELDEILEPVAKPDKPVLARRAATAANSSHEMPIVLESRHLQPKLKRADEEIPREVRVALAQARMIHNHRKHGFGWVRAAFAVTTVAFVAFAGLLWMDERNRAEVAQALQQAKAHLLSDGRMPASVPVVSASASRRTQ